MNFQKRKQAILQQLTAAGGAEIRELAVGLRVSEITIRRDLNQLAGDGLLRRTHGGAISISSAPTPFPFADKAAINIKAKEIIARRAAAEIADGDILFLDCGSTVFQLCHFIKNKKIRVITNSLPVIRELYDSEVDINIIGGEFDRERQAVHGKMAEYHISRYHAGKAFLGIGGVSEKGLFANGEKEATLTMSLAAHSSTTYLLCDRSKIGRESYWQFAGLDLASTVITDAAGRDCQFLKNKGVNLIHV